MRRTSLMALDARNEITTTSTSLDSKARKSLYSSKPLKAARNHVVKTCPPKILGQIGNVVSQQFPEMLIHDFGIELPQILAIKPSSLRSFAQKRPNGLGFSHASCTSINSKRCFMLDPSKASNRARPKPENARAPNHVQRRSSCIWQLLELLLRRCLYHCQPRRTGRYCKSPSQSAPVLKFIFWKVF